MLAIIPARSGSKRLPNKNKLLLNGKPLITYSLNVALQCSKISTIVVSTDDSDIAELCTEYDVIIHKRSDELSLDSSNIWDVCSDIYNTYSFKNESMVLLQPTSPLRSLSNLNEAIYKFNNSTCDYLISVCEYEKPIEWAQFIAEDKVSPLFSKEMIDYIKSKNIVRPNGAIYCINKNSLQIAKRELETLYYFMQIENSIDIDTALDFHIAEFLLNKNQSL